MKKIIFIFLALFSIESTYGQTTNLSAPILSCYSKPVVVYFKFNSSMVDIGYLENGQALAELSLLLSGTQSIDSIYIAAYTSPDGPEPANNRLAAERARAMKGYLIWKYPGLDQHTICTYSGGENWEGLRKVVMEDPDFPARKETLAVLDAPVGSATKEWRLKQLRNGDVYRYITTHNILRRLRNTATFVVWSHDTEPSRDLNDVSPVDISSIDVQNTIEEIKEPEIATIEVKSDHIPVSAEPGVTVHVTHKFRPKFAIKTNLLYDAALLPNVEGEYYFANRWSLNAEFQLAWWTFEPQDRFYQLFAGSPEIRYWLKDDGLFNGNYFGAYVGAGLYDLKYGATGYLGEFYGAGLSWGYMLPLKKHLALEFGLGVGYIYTQYDKYWRYYPYGYHYVYNGTFSTSYFGPTKAKVELVWRF